MRPRTRTPVAPTADGHARTLPEAVFPRHPELLNDDGVDYDALERAAVEGKRKWTRAQILHTMRGWAVPYLKSRVLPGDFHPIVAYLFTTFAGSRSSRTTTASRPTITLSSRR